MHHTLLFTVISVLFWSSRVSGCEGDCIVDITRAFLGNYSTPVGGVLNDLATQISTSMLPVAARPQNPLTLLDPIIIAYNNVSYDSLETAIFPSFFHGKCERFSKDGKDPEGCPKPNCSVVCGTPGSMVHFYPILRYLAFANTRSVFVSLMKPGSDTFTQVQNLIDDAQRCSATTRMCKRRRRSIKFAAAMNANDDVSHHRWASRSPMDLGFSPATHGMGLSPRSSSTASDLGKILGQFGPMLEKACGGHANNDTNALQGCSWEMAMKAYILSFP
ncbi:hypothetical protein BD410DRAFT_722461 [Rickenella mellea]|uniref:Uncharacterized protein n=1 Tax=Rickenella mellea TaxID=50990 RepID=A0A4Y7Q4W0_9AGAM|nr:hypothetical protein BD410DRAFT_722461 [Rickenella mellea]